MAQKLGDLPDRKSCLEVSCHHLPICGCIDGLTRYMLPPLHPRRHKDVGNVFVVDALANRTYQSRRSHSVLSGSRRAADTESTSRTIRTHRLTAILGCRSEREKPLAGTSFSGRSLEETIALGVSDGCANRPTSFNSFLVLRIVGESERIRDRIVAVSAKVYP